MSAAAAEGSIQDQPEHWINVLNVEPSVENIQELSVLLRQKPASWVQDCRLATDRSDPFWGYDCLADSVLIRAGSRGRHGCP